MAHLWARSEAGEWQAHALGGDTFALTAGGACVSPAPLVAPLDRSVALLSRAHDSGGDIWALLAGLHARVIVNGLPVVHGIVTLADRDEIRWSSEPPLYFSTEQLAAVVPFPADGTRGFCPRCKQAIAAGDAAVRCPGCGIWHHASEALPCWPYADHCAACPQPTALDAGFRWTPEEI